MSIQAVAETLKAYAAGVAKQYREDNWEPSYHVVRAVRNLLLENPELCVNPEFCSNKEGDDVTSAWLWYRARGPGGMPLDVVNQWLRENTVQCNPTDHGMPYARRYSDRSTETLAQGECRDDEKP